MKEIYLPKTKEEMMKEFESSKLSEETKNFINMQLSTLSHFEKMGFGRIIYYKNSDDDTVLILPSGKEIIITKVDLL